MATQNNKTIRYSTIKSEVIVRGERSLITTREGGKVALDSRLMDLWQAADEKTLDEILIRFTDQSTSRGMVKACLACLAEGGLLNRNARAPIPRNKPSRGKLVSIVIVAYRGEDWLKDCLPSIQKQTYSPLETIVVDNASPEPLKPWLASHFPSIKTIRSDEPLSIPAANNLGVHAARGEYFLILNQDTELEPDAISEMVRVIQSDEKCVSVAPKLKLYWARAFLNGLGNRVQLDSWGTDNGIGHLDLGQFDDWREIPSACTAGALFSRSGWSNVGKMDEGFPMYYDDPEWSYRARLLGYKILAAPRAVIYHAFGGRIPSGEPESLSPRKLKNAVYGRLRFVDKLLDDMRTQLLRKYLKIDIRNFFLSLINLNWGEISAYLSGWIAFLKSRQALSHARKDLQKRRVITDKELFALQADYPNHATWNGVPDLTWERIASSYYPAIRAGKTRRLPEFLDGGDRPSLLIISHDVVNEKMGGPGARYLKIAEALAGELEVTLAIPNATNIHLPNVNVVSYLEDQPGMVKALVENHDISLITGYMMLQFPFLRHTQKRLIVDLYDPFFLENMYYYQDQSIEDQWNLNDTAIEAANALMATGDFFICGTEQQRDFWLGMLAAVKRINPMTLSQDSTLRKLIDVVGVGFPEQPPQSHPVIRGKDVPKNARIVVWGGGIWNWLDPLTLVSAWPEVHKKIKNAYLIFLGTRYPNPKVPEHQMARQTIAAAKATGEYGRSIRFIEWLPYPDHQALLKEADVGITLQPESIETHFSIRTRVIDYFWAQLPSVLCEGDITARWVKQYRVGEVVRVGDIAGVSEALIRLLSKPKNDYESAFKHLRNQFLWSNLVEPIRQYCRQAEPAADLTRTRRLPGNSDHIGKTRNSLASKAFRVARSEGILPMLRRITRHIKWILFHK